MNTLLAASRGLISFAITLHTHALRTKVFFANRHAEAARKAYHATKSAANAALDASYEAARAMSDADHSRNCITAAACAEADTLGRRL